MKTKNISFLIALGLLFTGCTSDSPSNGEPSQDPGQKSVVSIALSGNQKTSFEVGDAFTYEGLIVTATYADETSAAVTGYTVSTPDMSSEGQKEVVVTYQSVNASYNITVSAKAPEEIPEGDVFFTAKNKLYENHNYTVKVTTVVEDDSDSPYVDRFYNINNKAYFAVNSEYPTFYSGFIYQKGQGYVHRRVSCRRKRTELETGFGNGDRRGDALRRQQKALH